MDRIILHCDLNSFYASVELLDHPELRSCPVAVCGDPAHRHGIILAKNESAKACGVKTAETIWQAKRKCPDLVLLAAHHEKYSDYSRRVNAVYARYTDLLEPFSIDESWLDLTGTLHLFGDDPKAVADEIRNTVREELGLTLSVGVSFNKIFAKLGSDYKKPDATTVILRDNYQQIVWPLPVSDLLFVGRTAASVLSQHGIHTIGQLAAAPEAAVTALLGKQGSQLHAWALGNDSSPVRALDDRPAPKSIGRGLTFPEDITTWEAMRTGVGLLADSVGARLRQHGMKPTTLQVTLRDTQFRDRNRQRRLEVPTYASRKLAGTAMELVGDLWDGRTPIRAVTVTASGLLPEAEASVQMDLSGAGQDKQRERQEKLDHTIDQLRSKYSKDLIGFGAAVTGHPKPIDEE